MGTVASGGKLSHFLECMFFFFEGMTIGFTGLEKLDCDSLKKLVS